MANVAPFFLTGANAKIKLNGVTLAFCTNLSYSITINTAAPKILGMYEPSTLEPLSYTVIGSFSVVRYVKHTASNLQELNYKVPNGVNEQGNGVGNWGENDLRTRNDLFSSDGKAFEALNPQTYQGAVGFDIQVYQKMPAGHQLGVASIRNCRITKADFTLSKRNPAMETFQFQALYVDEDSFRADFSCIGQNVT